MGRHGLQLDQVRFTMHLHALIKAEETRQGPALLEHRPVTNIIQFFQPWQVSFKDATEMQSVQQLLCLKRSVRDAPRPTQAPGLLLLFGLGMCLPFVSSSMEIPAIFLT